MWLRSTSQLLLQVALFVDAGQADINQHKEQEHPSIFSLSEKLYFKESLMDY